MLDPVTETAADSGVLARSLAHLEWSRVCEAVLTRCAGPSARRRGVVLSDTPEQARAALAQTREAGALLSAGEPLPLGELRDIDAHLLLLSREGTLDAPAFADLLHTLQTAHTLRRFLGGHRTKLPHLAAVTTLDPSLDELAAQLAASVDTAGLLLDAASEDLRRVRTELEAVRARITGRLQDLIAQQGSLLSDSFYTVRDGRYVLPVRRDAHDRLPGIVHGESASGASIFVEPRSVVAHGNQLKMLEAEHEREQRRILAALSSVSTEYLPALLAAAESLDRLDLRHAAAALGRDFAGCVPELTDKPAARLRAARHPLLALSGMRVVPSDLEIEAGHALVISGPNAGGKTVVLKTLGLCALMARAGLPLPVHEGSELGFFDPVLCAMGDDQSTVTNLSTFSAHVRTVAALLSRADERSLVLLDELASGTDPSEGAALAEAVVHAFCERGAALVVTTHYEALKAASLSDPRMRTASVGLDPTRMEPTFELLLGVPGASSALAVARRFGLPPEVVAHAERLVPEQTKNFEQLVQALHGEALALRNERAELQRERERLAVDRAEHERRSAELAERSKHKLSREAQRIMDDLRQARSELDTARAALRKGERSEAEVAAAQKALAGAAASVGIGSAVSAATAPEPKPSLLAPTASVEPVVGLRVYVPRLRSEAVVVEAPAKGKVLVAVGAMKLWVERTELHAVARTEPQITQPTAAPSAPDAHVMRSSDNTVDVRGLRAEDALAMLDSFIDRLYTGPDRVGYVLHGHGTGALRNAVREHLQNDLSFVQSQRAGTQDEGGDAVTVFQLAS